MILFALFRTIFAEHDTASRFQTASAFPTPETPDRVWVRLAALSVVLMTLLLSLRAFIAAVLSSMYVLGALCNGAGCKCVDLFLGSVFFSLLIYTVCFYASIMLFVTVSYLLEVMPSA